MFFRPVYRQTNKFILLQKSLLSVEGICGGYNGDRTIETLSLSANKIPTFNETPYIEIVRTLHSNLSTIPVSRHTQATSSI